MEDETSASEYLSRKRKARAVEAVWAPAELDGTSWAYKTDIPHVTFDLMEEGAIYCRGIVFALSDLDPRGAPSVRHASAEDTEGGAAD
jgi:hypothetical protein